jgi:hypothetical protein
VFFVHSQRVFFLEQFCAFGEYNREETFEREYLFVVDRVSADHCV